MLRSFLAIEKLCLSISVPASSNISVIVRNVRAIGTCVPSNLRELEK